MDFDIPKVWTSAFCLCNKPKKFWNEIGSAALRCIVWIGAQISKRILSRIYFFLDPTILSGGSVITGPWFYFSLWEKMHLACFVKCDRSTFRIGFRNRGPKSAPSLGIPPLPEMRKSSVWTVNDCWAGKSQASLSRCQFIGGSPRLWSHRDALWWHCFFLCTNKIVPPIKYILLRFPSSC